MIVCVLRKIILGVDLPDIGLQLLQPVDLSLLMIQYVPEVLHFYLTLDIFYLRFLNWLLRVLDVFVQVPTSSASQRTQIGTLLTLSSWSFHFIYITVICKI